MISQISIRDFAIIDRLNIDFREGLNIITGETGAGKSIVIEAVSLALGSRADTAFVRTGKEKAVIRLAVEACGTEVDELLEENGLPVEEPLVILREVSAAGKSACRVNGETVSVSFLNRLCRKIADIHGQYDHQSLLNPESHITFVDLSGENEIRPIKEKVRELYHQYMALRKELALISRSQNEAERKRDFMRFELSEITAANPLPGEDRELEQRLVLLQNSEKIFENLAGAYEILCDASPSAMEGLGTSMRLLEEISSFSTEIGSLAETVSDCYYRLEDLGGALRRERDSVTFSPEELNQTIERLDLLTNLKHKYGGSAGTLDAVLAYGETISRDIDLIENADRRKGELESQLAVCREQLSLACERLTALRREAAARMEKKINRELSELNFKDAVLTVELSPLTDGGGKAVFSEDGADRVEFLISTNRGEAAKPLAKIASGGEISRIMLAFKSIIGDYDKIPTLIFDEIDSGISGITASIVGRKLLDIAKNHQVICITHLPQIAAFGDAHYRIEKITEGDAAHTTVVPLDHEEKVREIARLLGGINITETTLKSAEELLMLSKTQQ